MDKTKRSRLLAALLGTALLAFGALAFFQLHATHQANERIIEECFENFDEGEVVIEKANFWSAVSCENR